MLAVDEYAPRHEAFSYGGPTAFTDWCSVFHSDLPHSYFYYFALLAHFSKLVDIPRRCKPLSAVPCVPLLNVLL